MSMTKKQALEVIQLVKNIFNVEFDKNKGMAWLEILTERGDYEKTMRNVKNRAVSGNKYRPSISEIIIPTNNAGNEMLQQVDETQTHAYKKKHSKEYAKAINEMEKLRNRLVKEVEEDE